MSKAQVSRIGGGGSSRENRDSLWPLVYAPAVWMLHFLLSYITAAVWCAKFTAPGDGLLLPRIAIGAYTLLALLAIALIAAGAYRRYRDGVKAGLPRDQDSAAVQQSRFLGFTTLLLCGLSSVATLYVALPILFIGSCR